MFFSWVSKIVVKLTSAFVVIMLVKLVFHCFMSYISVLFLQIKNLAADLCLDRAVVLKLLRDPPPNLVMLSATLPDKPAKTIIQPVHVEKQEETVALETTADADSKHEAEVKEPVHVMQSNWSARKRLKKVQIETLEEVYRRSKRPTVSNSHFHIAMQLAILF